MALSLAFPFAAPSQSSPHPSETPSTHPRLSPLESLNLRIGTAGQGQIVPWVGAPFAMTYWSPETRAGEVKCIAPYYDTDRTFSGIRGTHWISGSCVRDYGSFTLMPESGNLRLESAARAVPFDHAHEHLSPAAYRLDLPEQGIGIVATGRTRSGLMSFTFRHDAPAWVVLQNNAWAAGGSTTIDRAHNEISGSNPARRLYARAGEPAGFSGYFVVQFDHPIKSSGTWDTTGRHDGSANQPTLEGVAAQTGAYLRFELRPGETLLARIGTSFVSVEEARRNLVAEIPGWDAAAVERDTAARWNELLGQVEIDPDAPKDQREVFYTSLYHSFAHPRTVSDSDGAYPRFADPSKLMHAEGFTYYDDFSAWDTFRAVHPLFTLLAPDRDRDMVRSLVAKGQQGGFLPIFPAWNNYTSEMVGDHAIAIIYDAFAKGIRGFDVSEAYRLVRHNAADVPNAAESADGRGRRGLASYLKFGYIPLEDHVLDAFSPHQEEQVSRTMEYAFDDGLVSRFAADLGHTTDAELFAKRAGNWRNVLDPSTGYARGRHEDGSWVTPFDPNKQFRWLTEALASQQTFFVMQDVPGLIAAEGGREAFVAKLDKLFADGAYDQSNEPSHHIAYLYDEAGAPWKAQRHLAGLFASYTDRPDGLIGNDDSGQMSAWYVFSAMGFYPVTPGLPRYAIGTPLFPSVTLHLPGGGTFRIVADNAGPGHPYIAAATLNGKPLTRAWISHAEILAGGELRFRMSATPVTTWPQATSH
ncbi:GH92 family glycosyl hydrolase [Bryocella elongata]|uniref:GH92 family glycosyl hydrolase n=1 Tax=Bryocella elongata TaxID=863522 RepID=UPI001F4145F9|nr:GH92 family glycosyl hydrolase [Bryocella elongata]